MLELYTKAVLLNILSIIWCTIVYNKAVIPLFGEHFRELARFKRDNVSFRFKLERGIELKNLFTTFKMALIPIVPVLVYTTITLLLLTSKKYRDKFERTGYLKLSNRVAALKLKMAEA